MLGGLLLTGSAEAATYPLGWGLNGNLQASPVPTNAMSNVTAIAAGYLHSLALKDGRVWTWGDTANGLTNIPLAAREGVQAIAAGSGYSLALKTNGTVIGWGAGPAATNVPAFTGGVTRIAAGEAHALALVDGGIVAWGDNAYNQRTVPDGLTNDVTDIAAGGYYSLALKNGGVQVFGISPTNALEYEINAVPVDALSDVDAIAAGRWHALALKNGGVIAWGACYDGTNSFADATNVPPEATSDVVEIAAGDVFSIARKSDGTIVVWGDDTKGQLPIPNFASNGVTQVAAGAGHCLAVCGSLPPRFVSIVTPNGYLSRSYSNGYVRAAGDPAVTYHWGSGKPAWLALDSNAGTFSGTPSTLGTFRFSVVASNVLGKVTNECQILVLEKPPEPPIFVTTNLPGVFVGEWYDQTIVITNGGTLSIINGNLPAGLTMTTNGWITGRPTMVESPQFDVRVTNSVGSSTQRFQIVVTAPTNAPVFVTQFISNGVVGTPYSFQVETLNYPTNFGVVDGALPAGLGITAYGTITGTPTTVGTASFMLYATNNAGGTNKWFSLHVNGPPVFATESPLPSAVLSVLYSVQIEVDNDVNYFQMFGNSPTGLTLSAQGLLSGTPTAVGTYTFLVQAHNDYGASQSNYTLTVGALPVFVTPSNLPSGTAGVAYVAVQIEATGATAFSLEGSALPGGMDLNAAGLLAGTPGSGGLFNFTVRATNDYGYAERTFNLDIVSANTNLPFFTVRPLYTNGVLYLNWTNPNAGGAVSIWRSTNIVGTNAAWSNLGPASTSPWSNVVPPMPSYYQLRLQP